MRLPSTKFFRLAERLPAYRGVMQARVLEENEGGSTAQPTTAPEQRQKFREQGGDVATVPSTTPSYLTEKLKGARA